MPGDVPEKSAYRVEITEVPDVNNDGAIDLSDIESLMRNERIVVSLLAEGGDFASAECVALMDEADVVVTNPPFSLFRKYVGLLVEHDKKFLILGSQNAIAYGEIFKPRPGSIPGFGTILRHGIRWATPAPRADSWDPAAPPRRAGPALPPDVPP